MLIEYHDFSDDITLEAVRRLGVDLQTLDSKEKRQYAQEAADDLDSLDGSLFTLLYGSTSRGTSISVETEDFNYESDIDLVFFADTAEIDMPSTVEVYEQAFQVENNYPNVEIGLYDKSVIEPVMDSDPSVSILLLRRLNSGEVLTGEEEYGRFKERLQEVMTQNGLWELNERLGDMYESYSKIHTGDTKVKLLMALQESGKSISEGEKIVDLLEGEFEEKVIE